MSRLRRLLSDLLYPVAFFFWVAWYWVVPLGLLALILGAFIFGLLLR